MPGAATGESLERLICEIAAAGEAALTQQHAADESS
jgi:hypothetical protein